jgi:aldose 1-epimerase
MECFGVLPDGRTVEAYPLDNGRGLRVVVLTYGGILQAIEVPDRHGRRANVAVGFATLDEYLAQDPYMYVGALVGRFANRIAHGSFKLDDRTVTLATNNGRHHLHGGTIGFDRHLWTVTAADEASVTLATTSVDGEEGYPGTLAVAVTYTLTGDDALRIDYRATTDQPTVVNLTNHSYFNLGDSPTVAGHVVQINAGRYTAVDADLIPTGEIAPVDGTALDLRQPTALREAGGFDHNYVLDGDLAARVVEPTSGRVMTVDTTEPGLQLFVSGTGLALETQHFPDSPNHPSFPSTTLRPGATYRSTTKYTFSTLSDDVD